MEHGELCVRGTFYNRRSDLTVTKLDEMILQITFTGTDGKTFQFIGHPKRLPMLKLPANGSKKVTFNFGPFSGEWKDWATKDHRERHMRKFRQNRPSTPAWRQKLISYLFS